jgi:hypothetical protein
MFERELEKPPSALKNAQGRGKNLLDPQSICLTHLWLPPAALASLFLVENINR